MSRNDGFSDAWVERVGRAVNLLRYLGNSSNDRDDVLYAISVRAKDPYQSQWLVVGKRQIENRYEVAFHDSETADGALVGFIERMRSGDLKWHKDKFAYEDGEG